MRSREKKKILGDNGDKANKVITMQRLRGIGPISPWDLVFEYFGWRIFNNGKEVWASSGLAQTPYDSGESQKEQGISKAGNKYVRSTMIELAWSWIRYQPQNPISRWFEKRFGKGGNMVEPYPFSFRWEKLTNGIFPGRDLLPQIYLDFEI